MSPASDTRFLWIPPEINEWRRRSDVLSTPSLFMSQQRNLLGLGEGLKTLTTDPLP
ncbi:MAG TPA: hypothetical protein HA312_01095 [Candidatus Poseidonia sp.]|nr:hypothetical protein [Poseidonia sp.]